jgi:hypothetical protein
MLDFLRRVIFGPADFMPLDKRDDPYADMDEVWPSWLDDDEPAEPDRRRGLAPREIDGKTPRHN